MNQTRNAPARWSDADIETAVAILGLHSPGEYPRALEAIGVALGREVTAKALGNALEQRGLAAPTRHLGAAARAEAIGLVAAQARRGERFDDAGAAPWVGNHTGRDPLRSAFVRPARPSPEVVRRTVEAARAAYEPDDEPPATERQPAPAFVEADAERDRDRADLERLVAAVRAKPLDLLALCERLNATPARARELLALAEREGYRLRLADGLVALPKPKHDARGVFDFGPASPGRKVVAACSDLHFGSAACGERELASFVRYAYGKGARYVLVPGDVLDGSKKECVPEQDYVGFERQAARAVATMPRLEGLRYVAITGNHDEHFSMDAGFSAGAALENAFRAAGRDDWTCIGAGTGFARVEGALFNLHHPHGSGGTPSSAAALVTRRIDGYERDLTPDVVLQGHVHRFAVVKHRGVWGISCPSFQKNGFSVFGRRMASLSDVGGVLLSFDFDGERVDALSVQYRAISEIERRCA